MTNKPLSRVGFDSDGLERAGGLVARWVYEVMGARRGSYQFTHRHLKAEDAISEYSYQFPHFVDVVLRRRMWVGDPECTQDSAFCPCGPVGDWEIVGFVT